MYERMLLLLRDEAMVRNACTVVSPFHFSLVPILFIPILSGRSRKCPFFVQNPIHVQSSAEEYIENREYRYTTSKAGMRKGKLTSVHVSSTIVLSVCRISPCTVQYATPPARPPRARSVRRRAVRPRRRMYVPRDCMQGAHGRGTLFATWWARMDWKKFENFFVRDSRTVRGLTVGI